MSEERLFTVDEVAPKLRVSPAGVRKMIIDGRIAAVKIGRRYLVRAAEVERVLREGTSAPMVPSKPVGLAGGRTYPGAYPDADSKKEGEP
jgi:excisionase family DNA binding protein